MPAAGYNERTARFTPEERAHNVGIIVKLAKEHGLESAGAFSTGTNYTAVANSLGVFAYEPRTECECHAVIMADERGSGYTERMASDVTTLDFEAMAREAVEKAERSRNPIDIELGEIMRLYLMPMQLPICCKTSSSWDYPRPMYRKSIAS